MAFKQLVLLICAMIALARADSFLENWMGALAPILGSQTFMDLALPGSHDTLTYDLSNVVAEGGIDNNDFLAEVLHLASELGITPSEWVVNQSKTQGLTVQEQLNNGVRFLDFRLMKTSGDWYALHFMQSKQLMISYMQQVRLWLDQHPTEFVVMWLSKHGSACATGDAQFPNISIADKQAYWNQIMKVFEGVVIDTQISLVNETSINTYLQRGQRLLLIASDYVEFTNSSQFALDGCANLDNAMTGELGEVDRAIDSFMVYADRRAQNAAHNIFSLLSLAGGMSATQYIASFSAKYIPFGQEDNLKACAASFNLPVMNTSDWCPPKLQDVSQLVNYYNQLAFEAAVTNNYTMPNAIYLDAVDVDGTIRTGLATFDPTAALSDSPFDTTAYAYVDTMLLQGVKRVCASAPSELQPTCDNWIGTLQDRRAKHPFLRWDDGIHGRLTSWPF